MQTQITNEFTISENGYYGNFGGAYIPELLYKNVKELTDNYLKITVKITSKIKKTSKENK